MNKEENERLARVLNDIKNSEQYCNDACISAANYKEYKRAYECFFAAGIYRHCFWLLKHALTELNEKNDE
jgi:hypothetical protein